MVGGNRAVVAAMGLLASAWEARGDAKLPQEFLVSPKPIQRVYCYSVGCDGNARMLMELHNATDADVAFQTPVALSLTGKAGETSTTPTPAHLPTIDLGNCKSPLKPAVSCSFVVTLPSPLEPGDYALDIGVGGPSGGWSRASATVKVRHSYVLAFLAVVAGAYLGWRVQSWRSSGRAAFDAVIAVAKLRARLTALDDAPPALKSLKAGLADEIETCDARIEAGTDIAADVERINRKIDMARALAAAETMFLALPAEGQAALRAPRAALVDFAMSGATTDADRAAFETERRNLIANLEDWPRLAEARRAAEGARAEADQTLSLPLLAAVADPLRAARKALDDAAAGSLAAKAAGTEIGKRADDLDAKASALRAAVEKAMDDFAETQRAANQAKVQAFENATSFSAKIAALQTISPPDGSKSFEAPAPSTTPAPTPAPTLSLDAPAKYMYDLSTRRSVADILNEVRWRERLSNWAILVATGFGGVVAVSGNATWGSGVDVVTALLGGFGFRTVLAGIGLPALGAQK